jgi:hypothetical protein
MVALDERSRAASGRPMEPACECLPAEAMRFPPALSLQPRALRRAQPRQPNGGESKFYAAAAMPLSVRRLHVSRAVWCSRLHLTLAIGPRTLEDSIMVQVRLFQETSHGRS